MLWTIVAVLHILAAFLSKGYHQPDEYFQIIEFARHKLLGTSGDELAWEFGARIRPWLQPMVCAGIIKTLGVVGLTNPFYQTLVLRIVASALGFWSIVVLWRAAARTWIESEKAQTWLIAALGLAWFVPYLHARTSSENLATTMMCFAIAALMQRNGLVAGLCAAAAFEARFQMGFMLAGVFLMVSLEARVALARVRYSRHRRHLRARPRRRSLGLRRLDPNAASVLPRQYHGIEGLELRHATLVVVRPQDHERDAAAGRSRAAGADTLGLDPRARTRAHLGNHSLFLGSHGGRAQRAALLVPDGPAGHRADHRQLPTLCRAVADVTAMGARRRRYRGAFRILRTWS